MERMNHPRGCHKVHEAGKGGWGDEIERQFHGRLRVRETDWDEAEEAAIATGKGSHWRKMDLLHTVVFAGRCKLRNNVFAVSPVTQATRSFRKAMALSSPAAAAKVGGANEDNCTDRLRDVERYRRS